MIFTAPEKGPGNEKSHAAKGRPHNAAGKLRRILLVEDDYLAATDAEAALLDAGFEVIGPASFAEQAIESPGRKVLNSSSWILD